MDNFDFHGQTIVASYTKWWPFCIEDDIGDVRGIVPTLAKEVASMLNLSIEFVPFRERANFGNKLPNGSWSGNIGDIVNGLVQTSVSGYIATTDRSEAVDFTPALTSSVVALFIKRPGADDISAQNYLSQFPLTSWLAIGIAYCLCWTILVVLFYWQHKLVNKGSEGSKNAVIAGTESTFLVLMNKPPQIKPAKLPLKLAFFAMFLMSLLLMSCYKGLLKAALSVRYVKISIASYDDIVDSPLDFILWKSGALEDMFKLAPAGSVQRRLYETKIKDNPGAKEIGGNEPSMDLVRQGSAVFFAASENKMVLPIYPCQVTDVKPLRCSIASVSDSKIKVIMF